eukprot:scaffold48533_cov57-Phaeocystis_antarctica.AAC.2
MYRAGRCCPLAFRDHLRQRLLQLLPVNRRSIRRGRCHQRRRSFGVFCTAGTTFDRGAATRVGSELGATVAPVELRPDPSGGATVGAQPGFSACHLGRHGPAGATDPLELLDGGPGGSEGGSESDWAGPPASLGSMLLEAAADGATVVIVDRAASTLHIVEQPFLLGLQLFVALLQPPLVLLHSPFVLLQPPFVLCIGVTQAQLCHVRGDGASNERTKLTERCCERVVVVAGSELEDINCQHRQCQRELMSEAHAVRTVGEGDSQDHEGIESRIIKSSRHFACGNWSKCEAAYVKDAIKGYRGCPRP